MISLERRLYEVAQKEWDSQEPTGHSFALQTQKDVSTTALNKGMGHFERFIDNILYKRLIVEAPIAISVIIFFSLVLSLWQIEPIVSKHSKLISNTSMLFFHLSSFLKYSWKILSLFVKLHSPW